MTEEVGDRRWEMTRDPRAVVDRINERTDQADA
jgi:hypothetical protein